MEIVNSGQIDMVFSGHAPRTSNKVSIAMLDLVRESFETNKELWRLEDEARAHELGHEHIALAKIKIDLENQKRNNLIRDMDLMVTEALNVREAESVGAFYSESPGMIIDRLAILRIKRDTVSEMMPAITDVPVRAEYRDNLEYLSNYAAKLSDFLDLFLSELASKKAFFVTQRPIKMYNDSRIRKFIRPPADDDQS